MAPKAPKPKPSVLEIPSDAPPKPHARVTVVQIHDEPIADTALGPQRIWSTQSTHEAMHQAYVSGNPPPPARPFHCLSAILNAYQCRKLGWEYTFVEGRAPGGRHPSWMKVRHALDTFDARQPGEVTLVLDSDAWIRDPEALAACVDGHLAQHRVFLAAGEPDCEQTRSTAAHHMNGGFLCYLPDPRVKEFLQAVWDAPEASHPHLANEWPYEQGALGLAYEADVAGCREWLAVEPENTLNTPAGALVTHCWYKDLVQGLVLDDILTTLAQDALGLQRPTTELVIARFNEDIGWLRQWLPLLHRVTIYDKGAAAADEFPDIAANPKVTVRALPNVGREVFAYLTHFIDNYDALCDRVVCTQGRYVDHVPPHEFDGMVRSGRRPSQRGMDIPWVSSPMTHFGPGWVHGNEPMQPAKMTMAKMFLMYMADDADDLPPQEEVEWWPCAIFPVRRADVQRHSKEKYVKLRSLFEGSSNPEAAHIIERLWKLFLAR